jgi:hypothetical protein
MGQQNSKTSFRASAWRAVLRCARRDVFLAMFIGMRGLFLVYSS